MYINPGRIMSSSRMEETSRGRATNHCTPELGQWGTVTRVSAGPVHDNPAKKLESKKEKVEDSAQRGFWTDGTPLHAGIGELLPEFWTGSVHDNPAKMLDSKKENATSNGAQPKEPPGHDRAHGIPPRSVLHHLPSLPADEDVPVSGLILRNRTLDRFRWRDQRFGGWDSWCSPLVVVKYSADSVEQLEKASVLARVPSPERMLSRYSKAGIGACRGASCASFRFTVYRDSISRIDPGFVLLARVCAAHIQEESTRSRRDKEVGRQKQRGPGPDMSQTSAACG
ncbi:hypothetical protein C8R43DRAFT_1102352 [Mycena crocata]|nr:hypothetical protein C8R43DRAFT_1102352 [Mycena crocata]